MIVLRSEDERPIADDRWVLAWIASVVCSLALALIGFELGMTRTTFIVDDPRMGFLNGAVGHRPSFAPGVGTLLGTVIGATAGAPLALILMKERRRIRAVTIAWAFLGGVIALVVVGLAGLVMARVVPAVFISVGMIAAAATGVVLTMRLDLALRRDKESIESVAAAEMRAHPAVPAWIASFAGAAIGTYALMYGFGAADRWIETTANPAGGGFLDLRGVIGFLVGAFVGAVAGAVTGAWTVLRSARGALGAARVLAAIGATALTWLLLLFVMNALARPSNQEETSPPWKVISAIEATVAVVVMARGSASTRPPIARIVSR